MDVDNRRRLTPRQVEIIEWLLRLFWPDVAGGGERPDPTNKDLVAEVKDRLSEMGNLEQVVRDYIAGAYFDKDPMQRLRSKKRQLTLDSHLSLAAIGRGEDEALIREAMEADAAHNERLDGKYAIEPPQVFQSRDEQVECIVSATVSSADYRHGVTQRMSVDAMGPFGDLCQAVAARLSEIPVGTSTDGPLIKMRVAPTDWDVVHSCAVAVMNGSLSMNCPARLRPGVAEG